jgi:hypothetical protein
VFGASGAIMLAGPKEELPLLFLPLSNWLMAVLSIQMFPPNVRESSLHTHPEISYYFETENSGIFESPNQIL